jgi:hypothetical protein
VHVEPCRQGAIQTGVVGGAVAWRVECCLRTGLSSTGCTLRSPCLIPATMRKEEGRGMSPLEGSCVGSGGGGGGGGGNTCSGCISRREGESAESEEAVATREPESP